MDYSKITNTSSPQYKFKPNMYLGSNGLYYHKDYPEYFGVALGSYFGDIGTFYEFTLDTGKVLKVVKVEHKADVHTINGAQHYKDGSVIEFIINTKVATNHFGGCSNGYVSCGNFNNQSEFKGSIIKIKRIEMGS